MIDIGTVPLLTGQQGFKCRYALLLVYDIGLHRQTGFLQYRHQLGGLGDIQPHLPGGQVKLRPDTLREIPEKFVCPSGAMNRSPVRCVYIPIL